MTRSAACRMSVHFSLHRFTGKERDTESGNDYFDARYFASSMGRFMSPDWSAKVEPVPYAKMDDPQSLNLYSYVRNNPLMRTDADGHCCEADFNSFQTPDQKQNFFAGGVTDFDRQFIGHMEPGKWVGLMGTTEISTTTNAGFVQYNSTGSTSLQLVPSVGVTLDTTVHAPGATPNPLGVSVGTPVVSATVTSNSVTGSVGLTVGPPSPLNISADTKAVTAAINSVIDKIVSTARGAVAPTAPPPLPPKPPPPPPCQNTNQGVC